MEASTAHHTKYLASLQTFTFLYTKRLSQSMDLLIAEAKFSQDYFIAI